MNRVYQIDMLRGVAAALVLLSHLTTYKNPNYNIPAWLQSLGVHGRLGVEIFFVVSGFVIPYSLHQAGYRLSAFPTFLLKRIIRIDPPYIATIALTAGLAFAASLAPNFQGVKFPFTWYQTLLHLGYLADICNSKWIVPVFWTLAIEFQYYLLIGASFPLLAHTKKHVRFVPYALGAGLATVTSNGIWITHWLFFFMLGIALYQYRIKLINILELRFLTVACFVGASINAGIESAIAGLFTSIAIHYGDGVQNRILTRLGTISYSLYLIHFPVLGRTINLLTRYTQSTAGAFIVCGIALILSVFAAIAFYFMIERPAKQWAAQVRYKPSFEDHLRPACLSQHQ